jgi:hypothetical protein
MLYGVSQLVSTLKWETVCIKTLDPNQDTRQIEEKRDKSVTPCVSRLIFAVEKASANKEVNKFTLIICR